MTWRAELKLLSTALQWGAGLALPVGAWALIHSGKWSESQLLASRAIELYIWIALAAVACRLMASVGGQTGRFRQDSAGRTGRRRPQGVVQARRSRPEPLPDIPLEHFTPNLDFEGDMPPASRPDPTRVAPLTAGDMEMPQTAQIPDVPQLAPVLEEVLDFDDLDDGFEEEFEEDEEFELEDDDEEEEEEDGDDELWDDEDVDDEEWDDEDPIEEDEEEEEEEEEEVEEEDEEEAEEDFEEESLEEEEEDLDEEEEE